MGKRRRSLQSDFEEPETVAGDSNCHPVKFWARHQVWPPKFAEKGSIMRDQNLRKRLSSYDYTHGTREGQNPQWWSLAYEIEMIKYNMVMSLFHNQTTISEKSKQLCADLLSARYELPKDSLFEDDLDMAVFRGARARNEARVNRDITPLLVPSAEILHIRNITNLEHVIEEISTEWTQCSVIYGPRPKSDYVAGLASSAFTPDELLKLKLNHTADCPSYVTDCLYFPFLICEVNTAAGIVADAERQAMHNGSIAARAIVRLYEKVSRAKELNREILVLSRSHDASEVRLHGHYALIEDEKTTFFRHRIYSSDFTLFEGKDRWKAHHFTRKVYDDFYHEHLQRIRSALSQLDRLPSFSFISDPNIDSDAEGLDSQDPITSAPSSQNFGGSIKPSLPSTVRVQQENDRLNQQLDKLLKRQEKQQQELQQELQQMQQQKQQENDRLSQQNDRLSQQLDKLLKQLEKQQEEQRQTQQQTRHQTQQEDVRPS